jgi:hypothetical protein
MRGSIAFNYFFAITRTMIVTYSEALCSRVMESVPRGETKKPREEITAKTDY